jgi:hypothetical protein
MRDPALFHILLDHLEVVGTPLVGINHFVGRGTDRVRMKPFRARLLSERGGATAHRA